MHSFHSVNISQGPFWVLRKAWISLLFPITSISCPHSPHLPTGIILPLWALPTGNTLQDVLVECQIILMHCLFTETRDHWNTGTEQRPHWKKKTQIRAWSSRNFLAVDLGSNVLFHNQRCCTLWGIISFLLEHSCYTMFYQDSCYSLGLFG